MTQRMLVVVAHPDDESFGCGSILAQAAAAARHHRVLRARGEAGSSDPDVGSRTGSGA